MLFKKRERPEFCSIEIQKRPDSKPENIGVIKAPVYKNGVLTVDMLQTSMGEIFAIAATGNYPFRVIARKFDGSDMVFEEPTVTWSLVCVKGWPYIRLRVLPEFAALSYPSTFGYRLANVTSPENMERIVPRLWRKLSLGYWSRKIKEEVRALNLSWK